MASELDESATTRFPATNRLQNFLVGKNKDFIGDSFGAEKVQKILTKWINHLIVQHIIPDCEESAGEV
jgi:hypothetical protein